MILGYARVRLTKNEKIHDVIDTSDSYKGILHVL